MDFFCSCDQEAIFIIPVINNIDLLLVILIKGQYWRELANALGERNSGYATQNNFMNNIPEY